MKILIYCQNNERIKMAPSPQNADYFRRKITQINFYRSDVKSQELLRKIILDTLLK